MKSKLIVILLLLIFLGWFFSDYLFPDGFPNYVGGFGDKIREVVSF